MGAQVRAELKQGHPLWVPIGRRMPTRLPARQPTDEMLLFFQGLFHTFRAMGKRNGQAQQALAGTAEIATLTGAETSIRCSTIPKLLVGARRFILEPIPPPGRP